MPWATMQEGASQRQDELEVKDRQLSLCPWARLELERDRKGEAKEMMRAGAQCTGCCVPNLKPELRHSSHTQTCTCTCTHQKTNSPMSAHTQFSGSLNTLLTM